MITTDATALVVNRANEIVSFGVLISPPNANVVQKVKLGGGSFTDGKYMEVGLPEFMINDEEDEFEPTFKPSQGLYVLKSLTAHEYGHVWFTKFKDFSPFLLEYTKKMEAEGIKKAFASSIVQHIFNITEDARIEHRMTNLFPGLLSYFRYNNGIIWKQGSEDYLTDESEELSFFLGLLVCQAVIGIKPKWYKKTKGMRIRDEFSKVSKLLDDCSIAKTCKDNVRITASIVDEVWDYLIELMKRVQDKQDENNEDGDGDGDGSGGASGAGGAGGAGDDLSEAVREFIESLGDSDIVEGLEGVADGTETGSGDLSAKFDSKKGDNSGSAYDSTGLKSELKPYNETDEMAEGAPEYDRSSVTLDGGGSKKTIKSTRGYKTKTLDESTIDETMKNLETLVEADAKKEAKKKKEPEVKSSTLTKDEVNKIVSAVGYDRERVRFFREERQKYKMVGIPDDILGAAKKFRREVEKCFNNKNTRLTKMNTGRLDCKQLHRIGMDEYNLFEKVVNRSDSDAVVYGVWDGSGSMQGGKQKYSGKACSIIEYGLKGIVPFKLINFSVDWDSSEVVHYLVKDFDENNQNISYSTSYQKSKNFTGGNKDGYDIRIATEELLKRPEKDKILIVLSDGLPSDYNSINPEDDVKDAVKCARNKGITVIALFFGDESFRNDKKTQSMYEYMYQKNIVNSLPEELPTRLVNILRYQVLR